MTGCTIASLLGTGAQAAGQVAAGSAITSANNSAISNQQGYLGNIQGTLNPYTSTGAGASSALASMQGTNGQPANYSNFINMPGYQFAQQQGQQAAERQAAAMGNAGNSGTAAMIGNQVTGTAMQDYNTYVSQLQATANMGAGSANTLGNLTYNTGANTSQLMSNTGMAQAGVYTGLGQTVGSTLGPTGALGNIFGGSGTNTSGTGGSGLGNISAPTAANNYNGNGYYNPNVQSGTISASDPYGGQNVQTAPTWDASGTNSNGMSSSIDYNSPDLQALTGCYGD
jgi:hypothetical protein